MENAFAPLPLSRAGVEWYVRAIPDLMRTPGGFLAADFSLFVAFVGGVALWCNGKKRELFLLLLPFVFVLAASSLHKYPMSGRLMLFFVPALLLLVASGVSQFLTLSGKGGVVIAAASLCLLLPFGGEYQLFSRAPKAKDETQTGPPVPGAALATWGRGVPVLRGGAVVQVLLAAQRRVIHHRSAVAG